MQKMMQLFEELSTDYSCDSKVERYDSGTGELNAHYGVLAKIHGAIRGLGTHSERVKRIRSSPANADGTDAPDAVHVAQKTVQEFHNEKGARQTHQSRRSGRLWSCLR